MALGGPRRPTWSAAAPVASRLGCRRGFEASEVSQGRLAVALPKHLGMVLPLPACQSGVTYHVHRWPVGFSGLRNGGGRPRVDRFAKTFR